MREYLKGSRLLMVICVCATEGFTFQQKLLSQRLPWTPH